MCSEKWPRPFVAADVLEVKLWDANSGRDELVGSHMKDLQSERDDKRNRRRWIVNLDAERIGLI